MTLIAEDLSVTYPGPPPVEAVRNLSFTVEPGEFVTIVGPSGSGKSSLLQVLGALMAPTSGRVLIDDTDLGTLSEANRNSLRAHRLGFVFQEFHLINHRSVLDNAMVGALYQQRSVRQRRSDAHQALAKVGIAQYADTTPNRLSGGERQRVGIARALVGGPSLLLCDEPTGNLDAATTGIITELLDTLRRTGNLTVIVVTHDPELQHASDWSISLRNGTESTQP